MKYLRLTLALAALAFAPTLAKADPITYTFNQTYTHDANDYITVKGTLTTDGVIGTVAASDITGYDLFVSETAYGTASAELSAANSSLSSNGGLSADSDGNLVFDFSGSNSLAIGDEWLRYLGTGGGGFVSSYSSSAGGVYVSESGPTVIASVVSAPTPEPSSLLLLGTGVLGVAGVARRRLLR